MSRRLVTALALLAACGGGAPAVTEAPSTAPSTASVGSIPPQLADFPTATLRLGDVSLFVSVAATADRRSQGLMFVTDLGDVDGMVFVNEDDTTNGFWMLNTLIPLDIAWFDASGAFVSKTTMTPCPRQECPLYTAAGPYRYAIEAAEGDLDWVDRSTRLEVATVP